MDTTPDTIGYMIAGYAVIFITVAGYTLSLVLRMRRLDRERKLHLENGKDETKLAPGL